MLFPFASQNPFPKSQKHHRYLNSQPKQERERKRSKKTNLFLERESKHSPRNLCNQIRTCVCSSYTTLNSERKKHSFPIFNNNPFSLFHCCWIICILHFSKCRKTITFLILFLQSLASISSQVELVLCNSETFWSCLQNVCINSLPFSFLLYFYLHVAFYFSCIWVVEFCSNTKLNLPKFVTFYVRNIMAMPCWGSFVVLWRFVVLFICDWVCEFFMPLVWSNTFISFLPLFWFWLVDYLSVGMEGWVLSVMGIWVIFEIALFLRFIMGAGSVDLSISTWSLLFLCSSM